MLGLFRTRSIGPGTDKVVLNHRNPAVVFTRNGIGFVLNIVKGNLLEFCLVGVNSRSRVRVVHGAFTIRLAVITR